MAENEVPVSVKLTAEDTGVSAAIKELTSQLKNLKKQQDETATSGLSLKNAFQGIVAAASVIQFARIGKEALDSAVNIGKMADKTGQSTQQLSVFHHSAEELGVGTEAVDKAMVKAAKSITQFEQGSKTAAQGFALLGIGQKDFAGLNTDQKILLVTNKLGGMAAGLQKSAAAQLIFSKGGADFIPVANAIAGEGYDKITASVSKLGLLLTRDMTDSAQAAKASIQELEDVGAGMATQFEAGLLPAISDVGEALVGSLTKGGVSFQEIGKYAGDAVRGIALVFLGLGQLLGTVAASIEEEFTSSWTNIKEQGSSVFEALGEAARGHISEAYNTLKAGAAQSTASAQEEAIRQKAIWGSLADSVKASYADLFPSADEEARRQKERAGRLRPEKQVEGPTITKATPPTDAAAKAALSLLEKQLQDELDIQRAYAKQSAQIDSELFDQGEISLTQYYGRRRAEVAEDVASEIAILQRGVDAANAEAGKAATAKQKAATPKDADKQEAARLGAMQKVEELQTKITEAQINGATKIEGLNTEEFKKREDNQNKILEFHKLIDASQGKDLDVAKQEIAIEEQKLAIILKQSGETDAQVAAELAKYSTLKTAQATFDQDSKSGSSALRDLENQKAAIQDRVTNGKLYQVQADQQIRDLELSRLPQLQAIADQLVEQAKLTGDIQKIQSAEDFQRQVNQVGTASNQVGQQVAQLKQTVQGSLTSGFANLFTNLLNGTMSVGNAFKTLAGSVLNSLSQMAAQMLAQLILTKLLKSALGGFSGGGIVSAGGGGGAVAAADGGLIKGPGGPKADQIPARLSDGEFVVKADAVSQFGVHNLEAINRGLKVPSLEHLSLPKFAEGGLVGNVGGGGGDSQIHLGIGLDEGLILKHLSSKAAGNIVLQHIVNNPKAANKALSRSQ